MTRRTIDTVQPPETGGGAKILPFRGVTARVAAISRAKEELKLNQQALFEAANTMLTSLIGRSREGDGSWSFEGCKVFVNGRTCVLVDFSFSQYGSKLKGNRTGGNVHVLELLKSVPEIEIISEDSQSGGITLAFPVELLDAELVNSPGETGPLDFNRRGVRNRIQEEGIEIDPEPEGAA